MAHIPHVAGFDEELEPPVLRKPNHIPAYGAQNLHINSKLNAKAKEFTPSNQQSQIQHDHQHLPQYPALNGSQSQSPLPQYKDNSMKKNLFERNNDFNAQKREAMQNFNNVSETAYYDLELEPSSSRSQNYNSNYLDNCQNNYQQQVQNHMQSYQEMQQPQQENASQKPYYYNNEDYYKSLNSLQQLIITDSRKGYSNNKSSSSSSSNTNSTNYFDEKEKAEVEAESVALNFLQEALQLLSKDPGQYDTVEFEFIELFAGLKDRESLMGNAMEDIFKMSVETPNFQYMGARLYNVLHLFNPNPDSLFQALLKLKLEDHRQELLNSGRENVSRETAMFLAELYMQIRTESRMLLIAQNIVFTLQHLLRKQSVENIRCICLTLKLAGYDLSIDCPEEMKQIIQSLERIELSEPGKYPILGNVLSLQQNNWGRKTTSTTKEICGNDLADARLLDDPVFYGPDGMELTDEEKQFINTFLGYDLEVSEFDDVEDDYEKFLNMSKR